MGKKKFILIPVVLILAGVALWSVLKSGGFRYAGTVEATEVDLSSRVSSVISAYEIKEGDAVTRDQVLVKLAGEEIQLAASSAAADYERAAKLYKSGAIPFESYDHLRVNRDDTALRNSWCTVKSPLSGIVLDTYHETGEWVTPGTKLLTIGDLSSVWSEFYVPQTSLAKISLGMAVTGTLPELPGKSFKGSVTHISSEAEFTPKNVQTRAERTRLVYRVKVTFPNGEGILKPGMTLETNLPD